MSKSKKLTLYAVIAFVLLFLVFIAREAYAESAVEIVPGVSWVGSERYTGAGAMFVERFADKYDAALILMTPQECSGCKRPDYSGNAGVHLQRMVSWGPVELGLGGAYWANQTPAWSSNTTFALSAGITHGPVEIRWRHYSTGGSSARNSGLDMVTLGWRFR